MQAASSKFAETRNFPTKTLFIVSEKRSENWRQSTPLFMEAFRCSNSPLPDSIYCTWNIHKVAKINKREGEREIGGKSLAVPREKLNQHVVCRKERESGKLNNFMPFSDVNYRAMLTVVTTIVCLICYCCHRKIKMRSSMSSLYRQQRWLDNDPSMEIYSVEQVSCHQWQ